MTAKEFLKQYEHANNKARRLREEYRREMDLIDTISIKADGMPHGSGISKPTEDKALRLAEKAMRWKEAEVDAIEARQKVFEQIYDIPGIEGEVLIQRYVNLHKWEEICILLHYSWNGIHEAHRRALRIVESTVLNGTPYMGENVVEE